MDWKLALSTFVAVFLAELGDKTQLATFSLAAEGSSKMSVFMGAALALVATTVIAVFAGGLIGQLIPPIYIKRAAGVLFIVLGAFYLLSK